MLIFSSMKSARGFSIVELLVSLSIVILIGWLFLQPAGRNSGSSQRIKCVNNLKNLGLAVRIYADNSSGSRLSAAVTNLITLTVADYFRALADELVTPRVLTCPADRRVLESTNFRSLSNRNISFFANVAVQQNDSAAFLFGDRNLKTNEVAVPSGGILILAPNLDIGWTKEMHNEMGNITMSDGSVQQFSSERLKQALQKPALSTNRLLIP